MQQRARAARSGKMHPEGPGVQSPVHVDVVGLAAPAELGDIAVGRRPGLGVRERKGLLHAAAAQVDGRNGVLLGLAQVAQQVVEGQPGERALVSACSP